MPNHNSYISSATIKEQGRTAYYKMLENARQGKLIQVRRGLYASIDQLSGNMIDINTIVPGGMEHTPTHNLHATSVSRRHQARQEDNCSCFSKG